MAVYNKETWKQLTTNNSSTTSTNKHVNDGKKSSANGFGKLLKGVGRNKDGRQRVQRSDITNFIWRMKEPIGKKITYVRFCCDIWLQKDDINQTRLTVGGDRLKFDRKTSTKTAGLETIKIHFNSTISTKDAK